MSQNDPQRGGRKDGPPELDEILRSVSNKVGSLFGGGGNGASQQPGKGFTGIGGLVVGAVAALWVASGLYVVDERENAVLTQFGRYVETVASPGLHWHLPWPIQRSELVNMTEIRSLELGGGSASASNMVLTADQNVIEVKLNVQYTLNSARDYLFNNRFKDGDERDLVNQVAESAIREVIGRNNVDAVWNEGRAKVGEDTKVLMQGLLDRYNAGISIARVNIADVNAPKEVQEAFSDAVKARQDRERLINEGRAYYNDVVPRASGTAGKLLQEAEGYQQQVVSRAEGEADRFSKIAAEYAKSPQVTRDRMYYDTMQQVMQKSTKVIVDQKQGGNLLYLPLDKLMQQTAAPAPAGEVKPAEVVSAKPAETAPQRPASPLRSDRDGR
ncbi:FtsH protease activity modulator HflK [Chitinilyticum piscinae]|uniref:Protein HflK n=1 Tax=Chitinilyticum piscinae TaxID=2866724 RepID=A0A8J7KAX4_9NEIS|nr:FtsH protease activity modulator HflK [Chitinilyticum piscinae]MBE9609589.1 FtsH protease activity modulator HflK [Chitinilyticum piscinae]